MRTKTEPISIESLAESGISERFNEKLKEVYQNIHDPNTLAEAARNITIKLTFLPGKERDLNTIRIDVSNKLAGFAPLELRALITQEGNKFSGHEIVKHQQMEFADNVTEFKQKGGENNE